MLPTILMFLMVCLGVIAGYHLLADLLTPDAARVRRRLAREFDPAARSELPSVLFKDLGSISLDAEPKPDAAPRAGQRSQGLEQAVAAALEQAGMPLTPRQLAAVAAGLGFLLGVIAVVLCGPAIGVGAAMLGTALPLLMLVYRVQARREKLLRQLPNAFDLMARVLRAGSSVPQSLQAVVDAFEDPLATEFAQCQKQLELGLRPEETYQDMAQRCGVVEMRIFVMAMVIQRQTGGNLSEVLERLASLIRSRLRLRQQVKTLTAEGRLQGLVLSVLPFFVFGVMFVVNRPYAIILMDHMGLLLGAGVSMLVGMFWIRHVVSIDL